MENLSKDDLCSLYVGFKALRDDEDEAVQVFSKYTHDELLKAIESITDITYLFTVKIESINTYYTNE